MVIQVHLRNRLHRVFNVSRQNRSSGHRLPVYVRRGSARLFYIAPGRRGSPVIQILLAPKHQFRSLELGRRGLTLVRACCAAVQAIARAASSRRGRRLYQGGHLTEILWTSDQEFVRAFVQSVPHQSVSDRRSALFFGRLSRGRDAKEGQSKHEVLQRLSGQRAVLPLVRLSLPQPRDQRARRWCRSRCRGRRRTGLGRPPGPAPQKEAEWDVLKRTNELSQIAIFVTVQTRTQRRTSCPPRPAPRPQPPRPCRLAAAPVSRSDPRPMLIS